MYFRIWSKFDYSFVGKKLKTKDHSFANGLHSSKAYFENSNFPNHNQPNYFLLTKKATNSLRSSWAI